MNWHIQVLIIVLLCKSQIFLKIGDKEILKKRVVYDLQENDEANLPIEDQGYELLDDEYEEVEPQSKQICSGGYESKFTDLQNKMLKYCNQNGEVSTKRRIQGEENHIGIVDPRVNVPDLNDEIQVAGKSAHLSNVGHFSFKKHAAAYSQPFKRLQKFIGFEENNERYQVAKEDDPADDFEGHSDIKNDEGPYFTTVGYVLVPEQNQSVLLKDKNISKVIPIFRNEHLVNIEQGDQGLLMRIKSPEADMSPDFPKTPSKYQEVRKTMEAEKPTEEENHGTVPEYGSGLQNYLKVFKKKDESCFNVRPTLGTSANEPLLTGNAKANLINLNKVNLNGLVMHNDFPSINEGSGTIKAYPGYAEAREGRVIQMPFFKSKKEDEQQETKDQEKFSKMKFEQESKDKINAPCKDDNKKTESSYKSSPPKEKLHGMGEVNHEEIKNEVEKMVSNMIRASPQIEGIWSSLKENKPKNKGAACNLRSKAKSSDRKQVEDSLRKVMDNVNDIIEMEVQTQKDLAEFYETILEVHAEQAKKREKREKMLLNAQNLVMDSTDRNGKRKSEYCKAQNRMFDSDIGFENEDDDEDEEASFDMVQFDDEMAKEQDIQEANKCTHEHELDTDESSFVRKLHAIFSPSFLKLKNIILGLQREEIAEGEL